MSKVPVAVQEQNDFERNASELKSTAEMCGACCLKQWGALLINDQHESFGHVHCFHNTLYHGKFTLFQDTSFLHDFESNIPGLFLIQTFLPRRVFGNRSLKIFSRSCSRNTIDMIITPPQANMDQQRLAICK